MGSKKKKNTTGTAGSRKKGAKAGGVGRSNGTKDTSPRVLWVGGGSSLTRTFLEELGGTNHFVLGDIAPPAWATEGDVPAFVHLDLTSAERWNVTTTHAHMDTREDTYTRVHSRAHTHTHTHPHMHAQTGTHTHTYALTHSHTHTLTNLHTHNLNIYTLTHLHTYKLTNLHTYTLTHLHTYTLTHLHTCTHT